MDVTNDSRDSGLEPAEPEVLGSGAEPGERVRPGRWRVVQVAATVAVFGLLCGYGGYRLGAANERRSTASPDAGAGVRLEAADWFGDIQDPPLRQVEVQLNVTNRSARRVQIHGAGTSLAGLTLLRAEYLVASGVERHHPSPPFPIEPDDTVGIMLSYRVTDCAAAKSRRLPLPVLVQDGAAGTEPTDVDVGVPAAYAGIWQAGFLTSICPPPGPG